MLKCLDGEMEWNFVICGRPARQPTPANSLNLAMPAVLQCHTGGAARPARLDQARLTLMPGCDINPLCGLLVAGVGGRGLLGVRPPPDLLHKTNTMVRRYSFCL